jgi:hypothetical protein
MTGDEPTTCETYGRELTDAEIDDFGDECKACFDASHFVLLGV